MREARRHLLEPLDRSLVARPDLLHGRAARSPCAAEDLVRQAAQPGRLTQCAPLPHHSTASRTDKPSSSVIASSAPPARSSASRTAPSRSPSAVNTSYRPRLEPAFPIGTLFAQYRLGIQRRPACCLPHRLLTRHSMPR
jgi:hypothetical protein